MHKAAPLPTKNSYLNTNGKSAKLLRVHISQENKSLFEFVTPFTLFGVLLRASYEPAAITDPRLGNKLEESLWPGPHVLLAPRLLGLRFGNQLLSASSVAPTASGFSCNEYLSLCALGPVRHPHSRVITRTFQHMCILEAPRHDCSIDQHLNLRGGKLVNKSALLLSFKWVIQKRSSSEEPHGDRQPGSQLRGEQLHSSSYLDFLTSLFYSLQSSNPPVWDFFPK